MDSMQNFQSNNQSNNNDASYYSGGGSGGGGVNSMQQQQFQQQRRSIVPSGKGPVRGGRFDFDDGGSYLGGWEDGKAHGYGVCTGPRCQGEYAGSWYLGFEVSGIYTWPSGNNFIGQWQNGKRHGLGAETRGRWVYRGEWTQGCKGRYGMRNSLTSLAKYEGTWANGLQDGYGTEIYADSGSYQGQFQRGMRHGYGIRKSAPYGAASMQKQPTARLMTKSTSTASLHSDAEDPTAERDDRVEYSRGGFVLKVHNDESTAAAQDAVRRHSSGSSKVRTLKKMVTAGLRLRRQRSTSEMEHADEHTGSMRSANSLTSLGTSEQAGSIGILSERAESVSSFVSSDEILDANVVETYLGEWKNDKRNGFGVAERSDGIKYEGEWYNNKRQGYGVTTFKDGIKEEGKYKANYLVSSFARKRQLLVVGRATKIRERVEQATNAAIRASQIALQKTEIAITRTSTAHAKAEQGDLAALQAKDDSEIARLFAKQFAPDASIGQQQMGTFGQQAYNFSSALRRQSQARVLGNNMVVGAGSYNPMFDRVDIMSPSSSSSMNQTLDNVSLLGSINHQQQQQRSVMTSAAYSTALSSVSPNFPVQSNAAPFQTQQQQYQRAQSSNAALGGGGQRLLQSQSSMTQMFGVDGASDTTTMPPLSPNSSTIYDNLESLSHHPNANYAQQNNNLQVGGAGGGGGGGFSRNNVRQLSIRGSMRRVKDYSAEAAGQSNSNNNNSNSSNAQLPNNNNYQQQQQQQQSYMDGRPSNNDNFLQPPPGGGGGGARSFDYSNNNNTNLMQQQQQQQQSHDYQRQPSSPSNRSHLYDSVNNPLQQSTASTTPTTDQNHTDASYIRNRRRPQQQQSIDNSLDPNGSSGYGSQKDLMRSSAGGGDPTATTPMPTTSSSRSPFQRQQSQNSSTTTSPAPFVVPTINVSSQQTTDYYGTAAAASHQHSSRSRQRSIFDPNRSSGSSLTRSSSAKRGSLPEVIAAHQNITAAARAAAPPSSMGAGAAMAGGGGGGGGGVAGGGVPRALAREVVSSMSIEMRERMRQQAEQQQKMKQNPILYLFHPTLVNWLGRYKFFIFGVLFNFIAMYVFYNLLWQRRNSRN